MGDDWNDHPLEGAIRWDDPCNDEAPVNEAQAQTYTRAILAATRGAPCTHPFEALCHLGTEGEVACTQCGTAVLTAGEVMSSAWCVVRELDATASTLRLASPSP